VENFSDKILNSFWERQDFRPEQEAEGIQEKAYRPISRSGIGIINPFKEEEAHSQTGENGSVAQEVFLQGIENEGHVDDKLLGKAVIIYQDPVRCNGSYSNSQDVPTDFPGIVEPGNPLFRF